MGETANGRSAYARDSLDEFKAFLRQGERIGLMCCRRLAGAPIRPFAHSPPAIASPMAICYMSTR